MTAGVFNPELHATKVDLVEALLAEPVEAASSEAAASMEQQQEEPQAMAGAAAAAGKGSRARDLAHQLAMRELQSLKGPAAADPSAADAGTAAAGKKGRARSRSKSSSGWESVPMMVPTTAALASAYDAVTDLPIASESTQEAASNALKQQQAEASAAAAVETTAKSLSAAAAAPAGEASGVLEGALGAVVDGPQLEDIEAAMHEDEGESDAALSAEDERPDIALDVFDHLEFDVPAPAIEATAAAATAAGVEAVSSAEGLLSAPGVAQLADIAAAMHEDEEELDAAYNSEDEKPDVVLDVFDHLSFDTPAAAAAAVPQLADIAAAMHEDEGEAESAYAVEDEKPDVALNVFDHLELDTSTAATATAAAPGAAAAAVPQLADIAAAMHEDEGEAEVEYAVEDEKPDAALNAFDHLELDISAAATATAAPVLAVPQLTDIAAAMHEDEGESDAAYTPEDEQPDVALNAFDHLDLSVPAAAAGRPSGSSSLLKAEQQPAVEVAAVRVAAVAGVAAEPSVTPDAAIGPTEAKQVSAPAAVSAVAATADTPRGVAGSTVASSSSTGGGENVMVMVQKWWQSILDMFGDWGSKLNK